MAIRQRAFTWQRRHWRLLTRFLLALAFLVKQTAGVLAASVGIYWLTQWFSQRKEIAFVTFFKPILSVVLGFILPILLIIIGLWAIGSWKQ